MDSATTPKAIEPDDVVAARADERLVHAYDEIARADEQLARLNEQLSTLERDAAHRPAAVLVQQRPRSRPVLRGFIGLLLAVCIFAGAFVSQTSYGKAIARWMPQPTLASSLPMDKPGLPAQPSPSSVQLAAVTRALEQITSPAQSAPQDVAPTAAPISPDLAQLLQTMARDIANLEQGIGQLKANQEQAARENAKATEDIKASQEQMTRLIAKASENKASEQKASEQNRISGQNQRARTSVPPPPPIAVATRKPVPTQQLPQARARPQTPAQVQRDQ